MRGMLLVGLGVLGLSACANVEKNIDDVSAQAALRPYYASIPDSALPQATVTPKLDDSSLVSRVLVASCIDEEQKLDLLDIMAADKADLTLLIGDNVYGDYDSTKRYISNDIDLVELRESYAELGTSDSFKALRASRPMLATWDDHDYGANDASRDFPFKEFAQRIFENFYGQEAASPEGVYSSIIAGPEGQRLQVILTDTRYFRSELAYSPDTKVKGQERYIPTDDESQAMLGDAQWTWLEEELQKPAELRLLISSIQVVPDVHGWEAWATMPKERSRLYGLLTKTQAKNTILVSGDRHAAYLYKKDVEGLGSIHEMTTSSINSIYAKTPIPDEYDANQIGDGYAFANYGSIDVDWEKSAVELSILDEAGDVVRSETVQF